VEYWEATVLVRDSIILLIPECLLGRSDSKRGKPRSKPRFKRRRRSQRKTKTFSKWRRSLITSSKRGRSTS